MLFLLLSIATLCAAQCTSTITSTEIVDVVATETVTSGQSTATVTIDLTPPNQTAVTQTITLPPPPFYTPVQITIPNATYINQNDTCGRGGCQRKRQDCDTITTCITSTHTCSTYTTTVSVPIVTATEVFEVGPAVVFSGIQAATCSSDNIANFVGSSRLGDVVADRDRAYIIADLTKPEDCCNRAFQVGAVAWKLAYYMCWLYYPNFTGETCLSNSSQTLYVDENQEYSSYVGNGPCGQLNLP